MRRRLRWLAGMAVGVTIAGCMPGSPHPLPQLWVTMAALGLVDGKPTAWFQPCGDAYVRFVTLHGEGDGVQDWQIAKPDDAPSISSLTLLELPPAWGTSAPNPAFDHLTPEVSYWVWFELGSKKRNEVFYDSDPIAFALGDLTALGSDEVWAVQFRHTDAYAMTRQEFLEVSAASCTATPTT